MINLIVRTLENYSEKVRIRRQAINSGLSEETKAGHAIRKMQELQERSQGRLEGAKESQYIPQTESINFKTNENHQYATIEEDKIYNVIQNKDVPDKELKEVVEEFQEKEASSMNTYTYDSKDSKIINTFDNLTRFMSSKDDIDAYRLTLNIETINS